MLTFFFSNRSLGTFFHGFRFRFRDSVSMISFPDSGFRILCFSAADIADGDFGRDSLETDDVDLAKETSFKFQ